MKATTNIWISLWKIHYEGYTKVDALHKYWDDDIYNRLSSHTSNKFNRVNPIARNYER